jgi:hypothetical protein
MYYFSYESIEIIQFKGVSMGTNQHVVPNNGQWGIKGAGNSRFTGLFESQSAAVREARTIAQNQGSELFIHGRNGQIRDRDSFGNDPCPPRDRKY